MKFYLKLLYGFFSCPVVVTYLYLFFLFFFFLFFFFFFFSSVTLINRALRVMVAQGSLTIRRCESRYLVLEC